MRTRWRNSVVVALTAAALAAAPASAEDTAVIFSVDSGGLSLSAPASANLGSATASALGTTVTGKLGESVVNDLRGSVAGSWTITLTISNFTTGDGVSNRTLNRSQVSLYSGVPVTVGTAVVVPTTALTAVGDGGTVLAATAIQGSMTSTYNPTAKVAVPATAAAGVYTGTITQTIL